MPKLDDQISTLQERLTLLKLRQQRSDARKRAMDAQRERKAETRRSFVMGALVLTKIREGSLDRTQLWQWLDELLTRRDDRKLFDLPPGPEGASRGDPAGGPSNPPEAAPGNAQTGG